MNRTTSILLIIIIILLAILIIPHLFKNYPFVIIDNKKFFVDIAKTQEQKEKGLGIYKSLPIDRGMIFTFQTPGYYAFWMQGMKFPIDIIYIKKNKVVDIFKNVPVAKNNYSLSSVIPKETADTVLEINAGLSSQYKFKIGDAVKIYYDNTRN